ncbi:hypothetical protein GH733_017186 [Mirounga leonina]|nr:hypothetical protein GH733_017186 [Mirounga leonina]
MRELCIPTPCTISYPRDGWNKSTPACGYWFQNRDKPGKDAPVVTTHLDQVLQVVTRGCFHLLRDPGKYNCALSIIDTRRMEAGTYFFQMESGNAEYNYLYDLLSLHDRDMLVPGLGILDPRGDGASREGPGASPACGWGTEVLGMRDMGKDDMRRTGGTTASEDPLFNTVSLSHP